jgi:Glyoxalase-like domain
MMFWQLTIGANDPAVLARFWAQALGYQPVPPTGPATTRHDDPKDPAYFVVMHDPEGNEFCVG